MRGFVLFFRFPSGFVFEGEKKSSSAHSYGVRVVARLLNCPHTSPKHWLPARRGSEPPVFYNIYLLFFEVVSGVCAAVRGFEVGFTGEEWGSEDQ